MKTYCFDIDGTICNNTDGNYPQAIPYTNRIDLINRLFDEGNTIIFFTARGATSGIDWAEFTQNQLINWGVKFHTLYMKPYYDIMIDDKAMNDTAFFGKLENEAHV